MGSNRFSMFFPYRARITLFHTPVVTVIVCALCFAIFTAQYSNQRALHQSAVQFCEREGDGTFLRALKWLGGNAEPWLCAQLMLRLYHARDARAQLAALTGRAAGRNVTGALAAHYEEALFETYGNFRLQAPGLLTARLWYPPDSWNPLRMLTASVAHGSWAHLMGNLLFFYAFAATIEILLGPILYLLVLVALAIGTHSVYSIVMMGNANALPTVGLSGIVMGMIALFVYFIPRARISCFLWLVVFYRRFAIPAWILAAWYIGWDLYTELRGAPDTRVNVIAHLSGAAIGFLLGFTLFRKKRHWAQELVEDK
ncbi:MAG: rhomboid family intramembrane serine protease [Betaproteobacteria bacterium]